MVQRSPPPPMGLPGGQGITVVCDPPPPTSLPGVKSNKAFAATPPPPPTDFPPAFGDGDLPCLLTAPPPPAEISVSGQLVLPLVDDLVILVYP
eukprot:Skav213478  [mRNA]  locus=scaffold565:129945:136203:+ [translate_table: standard]